MIFGIQPKFTTAPSAPLNLTFPPGGVLNDSITLTWLPPQHPNGVVRFYVLRWSSFGVNFFVNTTGNTTTLSDLTPGTQYTFSVRAFTVAFGPFSAQLTLHTADGEDILERMERHHVTLFIQLRVSTSLLCHFIALCLSQCPLCLKVLLPVAMARLGL